MEKLLLRRAADHLLFAGIALLLLSYVLLGFWQSYIGAGWMLAPLPSLLVHVHAVLFVGWALLFGVQIAMVATGRVLIHRRIGSVMGWWAAMMILVGPVTVVMALRRPNSGVGAAAFAGDLAQTVVFLVLIGKGFVRRRNAPEHKRLMALGTAALMGPAIVRWPFDFIQNGPPIGIPFFYLLPPLLLVAYDLATLHRVHRATWLGLVLMTLVLGSFFIVPDQAAWQTFTEWVKRA